MMKFTKEQLEKIISEAPEGATHIAVFMGVEYFWVSDAGSVAMWSNGNWSVSMFTPRTKLIELAEQLQEMKMKEPKKAEIDNTAQQVESLAEESEYDKGMRECVKDIARIVGLNFPANVGYGNLADEVKASIDNMDYKLERAIKSLEQSGFVDNGGEYWKPPVHPMREKLIKALGYMDHHLSIDGLIERVAEMREELDKVTQSALAMSERDIEGVIEWKRGDKCLYKGHEGIVIEWHPEQPVIVIDTTEFGIECATLGELSKPLTPEQKQQKIDEKNGELLFDIFEQIDFDMRNEPKSIWDNTTDEWKNLMIEAAKQIDFEGKLESI